MRAPEGATSSAMIGNADPTAKLSADTVAACHGRANTECVIPSSSRKCAPRGSAAVSFVAT